MTAIVIDYPGRPDSGVSPDGQASATADRSVVAAPMSSPGASSAGKERKSSRPLLYLFSLLILMALAAFVARAALNNSWYVGVSRQQVAIFNGISGSIGGLELSKLKTRTDIRAADLPELYQRRLEEGIKADDRADARSIVSDLKQLAKPTVPPANGSSPPPGETTAPTDPAGPP